MQHTPGPWRWEIDMAGKGIRLVVKNGPFESTVLQTTRWGASGGTLMARDSRDERQPLHRLQERQDWISPFPGREHFSRCCAGINHPDMRLIEAAPDLLVALQAMLRAVNSNDVGELVKAVAESAIRKATAP